MTRKLFTKQVKIEGFPKGIVEKERHFSRGYTEDRGRRGPKMDWETRNKISVVGVETSYRK